MKMTNWKKTVGQKIRHIDADAAKAILASLTVGIGNPVIRDLTGGFSSQNIDFYVIRKLAAKSIVN